MSAVLHKTLLRQWQRVFGELGAEEAGNERLGFGIEALLQRISQTYEQHERDLLLLHRSLDISSQELVAANRELQGQLASRDRVLRELRAQGIEAQIGTYALHLLAAYRAQGDFPGAARVFERALALPFHTRLTEPELDRVADALASLLA
jgi:dTDP-4-amino-4,6-dideoxygalactose transaminase